MRRAGETGASADEILLEHGAATDTGLIRSHNEDSYLAARPVFLVADGMGGHEAGDTASKTALAAFAPCVGAPEITGDALMECLGRAARDVDALGAGRDPLRGLPGCTLSGVVVTSVDGRPCLRVINIGDSRTYRMTPDGVEQITVDHSEVQELMASGQLTEGQAQASPRRHVITRALGAGIGPVALADHFLIPARVGDRLIVCTDGISGEIDDDSLAEIIHRGQGPQETADALITTALGAGGKDNATVIVIDVTHVPPAAPDAATDVDSSTIPSAKHDTLPRVREQHSNKEYPS
ncbi:PP2C family protein-serine/threonine phosphatase [Actinomyces marmotae]|uniref:Serine/threonine-protein phosphatase n=1 Tax=Actinomyces marmotae TaxID=2737173 RepID=A0A6M8B581_9ACTO|nr:protein phosphatase 2C domain-containing protein [Actinomyces marmotae]QKD79246.1 serine/threonine-protein phosphatase [Actinomyces marmotae]